MALLNLNKLYNESQRRGDVFVDKYDALETALEAGDLGGAKQVYFKMMAELALWRADLEVLSHGAEKFREQLVENV